VEPDKVKAIVIKVVSGRDSVTKLVCQNDEFASSLENTTAFVSLAKDSSTEGSGKFSRLTDNDERLEKVKAPSKRQVLR
jgi:hypothetical protein